MRAVNRVILAAVLSCLMTSVVPVLASDSNRQLTRCILLERIMEEPSIALQVFKRNQILQILDERAISGFKRNMSLKTLIAWCIENVSNLWDVFPSIYVFKFAENFHPQPPCWSRI